MTKKKKLNIKKLLKQAGYWLVFVVLIGVAGLVAISTLNIPGNYKLLVVQSGSMEPAIKMGSVVVVKPASDYQPNEIVTYHDPDNPKYTITHRIVGIEYLEQGKLFVTKGDANDAQDRKKIEPELVVGKVESSIPWLGFLISFAKTQTGLITLVIIPATLIIYTEIVNIKSELGTMVAKKRAKKRKRGQIARAREIRRKLIEMSNASAET
jgi:signal peptidase